MLQLPPYPEATEQGGGEEDLEENDEASHALVNERGAVFLQAKLPEDRAWG
jgi:hypothetical protein